MVFMNSKILFVTFNLFICSFAFSQEIQLLNQDTKTHIRGLSVVNDNVVWVSGSNGMVGRSLDAGNTWEWTTVKGYEKRDFRDIEAFSKNTAVIMGIAEPAVILKTTDGGKNWKLVYENSTPGMFLDAMEFWNHESGIVLGDPVHGRFFIARTFDGGNTWKDIPFENRPIADSGEACFAASGTNIRTLDRDEACFVSGGRKSRLFWKGETIELPLVQGKESTGANSIAVRDVKKIEGSRHLVVVGGDFSADSISANNCAITYDGGDVWVKPTTPPSGYRSCVEYISKERLITCGITGVDISSDGGRNWSLITKQGFHVCRKAKKGKQVFLAGSNGRIAKLKW
jgi:photosystem II stability/assembly factor-like uncharacterized protein